jgi:zinc protease
VLATTSTSARRLYLVDKADRTQAQLRLGHLSARFGEPDTAALLIAETAFGGMFSSRLMQEIRVKRGWSYGAGCALRRSRGRHWFEMWMATAIEVAAGAVALTHELYAELAEHGPRADEIDLARSYLLGAMPFHTATARQRMQLAVRDAVFGLPPGYSAELPRAVAAITSDDIRAACQRHLHPDQLVTVAVTTAADTHDGFDQGGIGPISTVRFDEY